MPVGAIRVVPVLAPSPSPPEVAVQLRVPSTDIVPAPPSRPLPESVSVPWMSDCWVVLVTFSAPAETLTVPLASTLAAVAVAPVPIETPLGMQTWVLPFGTPAGVQLALLNQLEPGAPVKVFTPGSEQLPAASARSAVTSPAAASAAIVRPSTSVDRSPDPRSNLVAPATTVPVPEYDIL